MRLHQLSLIILLTVSAYSQQAPYKGAMEGSRPPNVSNALPLWTVYTQPKGLPYCADIEWDNLAVAPNGNPVRIVLHGRDCRDSLGRYFRDAELPMKGSTSELHTFRHTTIIDPVQGRLVYLNPSYKFGTVYRVLQPPEQQSGNKIDSELPAAIPGQSVEDLGYKEIAGIRAHGTKIKYQYAGGNGDQLKDRYKTVETWYSEDLKITVLRIQTEPDGRDTIMRLSSIQRIDPDPIIFEIPPDYRLKEVTLPAERIPND